MLRHSKLIPLPTRRYRHCSTESPWGRKISDEQQVLNLAEAANELPGSAHGRYMPPPTEPGGENLRGIYARGKQFTQVELDYVFEQAISYFLFAALQQFYFDGNKRTARYMMNGHIVSQGFDAISVPAARRQDFNASMVDFFTTKDGTGSQLVTRALTEAMISARPALASEKNIPVFGSMYSSLSIPA